VDKAFRAWLREMERVEREQGRSLLQDPWAAKIARDSQQEEDDWAALEGALEGAQ
jgi:hypothetical protein